MEVLVANAKSASALAVIRSLGKKGITVTGASDNTKDFPLFSKYCHRTIILQSNQDDPENRIEELLEIVKRNKFEVFIPVMREELLLTLAKRNEEFNKYTRVALSSFDNLSILNDKSRVSTLLKELAIPSPKAYYVTSEHDLSQLSTDLNRPLIIKPIRGEGSEGIRIVSDHDSIINALRETKERFGHVMIQEFIYGEKYSAVFLLNKNSEIRRFFVHRVIREFPLEGGPACFLESIKYEPIFEYGLQLLKKIGFTGMAEMEFIIDERDGKPKIIDVNPRFYGSVHCAVVSGADFPYDVYNMALKGDIEPDPGYRTGVTCRHLLFEDTKHMISVLRGNKSPKYRLGRMATLRNYISFMKDDSYFVLSCSDFKPALRKVLYHL